MTAITSYSSLYRYFMIEDDGLSDILDGFYQNSDAGSNAIVLGGTATEGSLLPGNIVIPDLGNGAFDVSRPQAKRPSNTATTTGIALADPSTAATVADSGAADGPNFAAAAYTLFYVGKNAAGQITARSATTAVTPTATHSLNVTIPATGTAAYTSADVYCSVGAGGAAAPLAFLGNILQANFNAAVKFTTPPTNTSALAPVNLNTTAATTLISGLANVQFGVVFQTTPYLRYAPKDNSYKLNDALTIVRGQFTALMDLNSFETGNSPTTVGQAIYPSANGVSGDLGKLSTVKVGTAATPDLRLGSVVGFEVVTANGGPGPQMTSTYVNTTTVGAVTRTIGMGGGATVARVRFNIPYVPQP